MKGADQKNLREARRTGDFHFLLFQPPALSRPW
jgi:hypothetical protein